MSDINTNLSFSGHETFACKHFWLKKGYEYVKSQQKFSNAEAVVALGVGKNMVSSIQFWLKAFGLVNDNELTKMAVYLLDDAGKDPYMEDIGTLFLLHYQIIKTQKASIYTLLFNEYLKDRLDFNKDRLVTFLSKKAPKVVRASIEKDIEVLFKNYLKPRKTDKIESIEEAFSGVFSDLPIIEKEQVIRDNKKEEVYRFMVSAKKELPWQIFLYTILDNELYKGSNSISLRDLRYGKDSPGLVFGINKEGLYAKIAEIQAKYPNIIFTETAGNPVLQFKELPNKETILDEYYQ